MHKLKLTWTTSFKLICYIQPWYLDFSCHKQEPSFVKKEGYFFLLGACSRPRSFSSLETYRTHRKCAEKLLFLWDRFQNYSIFYSIKGFVLPTTSQDQTGRISKLLSHLLCILNMKLYLKEYLSNQLTDKMTNYPGLGWVGKRRFLLEWQDTNT